MERDKSSFQNFREVIFHKETMPRKSLCARLDALGAELDGFVLDSGNSEFIEKLREHDRLNAELDKLGMKSLFLDIAVLFFIVVVPTVCFCFFGIFPLGASLAFNHLLLVVVVFLTWLFNFSRFVLNGFVYLFFLLLVLFM